MHDCVPRAPERKSRNMKLNRTRGEAQSLKLLVIVPCGHAKVWKKEPRHGPAKARNAYIGAPFKVNKAFAEKFADRWIVLSAKHGLIDPDFTIPENYNVTFKKPSTHPIGTDALTKQMKQKNLDSYNIVIALGGEDYINIVKKVFQKTSKVIAPAQGLPIGMAMGHVKSLTKLEKEQMLRTIAEHR